MFYICILLSSAILSEALLFPFRQDVTPPISPPTPEELNQDVMRFLMVVMPMSSMMMSFGSTTLSTISSIVQQAIQSASYVLRNKFDSYDSNHHRTKSKHGGGQLSHILHALYNLSSSTNSHNWHHHHHSHHSWRSSYRNHQGWQPNISQDSCYQRLMCEINMNHMRSREKRQVHQPVVNSNNAITSNTAQPQRVSISVKVAAPPYPPYLLPPAPPSPPSSSSSKDSCQKRYSDCKYSSEEMLHALKRFTRVWSQVNAPRKVDAPPFRTPDHNSLQRFAHNLGGIRGFPGYHGHPGYRGHPLLRGHPGYRGHPLLRGHPGLRQHPGFYGFSALQGFPGLSALLRK